MSWREEGGPVLGVLADACYLAGSLTLRPGDAVVLYTDGVVDAENGDGDPYACERLAAVVRENAARSAAELLESIPVAVREFTGNRRWSDDATLLVIKVTGPDAGPIPEEAP